MALYTFYSCRGDGVATAFEAHDLRSDAAARARAEALLADHRGAVRVVAYQEAREVAEVTREGAAQSLAPAAAAAAVGPGALERVRGLLRARADDTIAVIATRDDGAILFWNRGARSLYGWSEAETIGRNVVEVTPAVQSREAATEIMDSLRRGEAWQGEIVLRKRSGAPFRAFVADTPLTLDGRPAAVIVGASASIESKAAVISYCEALRRDLEGLD